MTPHPLPPACYYPKIATGFLLVLDELGMTLFYVRGVSREPATQEKTRKRGSNSIQKKTSRDSYDASLEQIFGN